MVKPDDDLPYIHKLTRLSNLSDLANSLNENQKDLLDRLTPLNIEARYPTSKENLLKALTDERCKSLIKETEEMLAWIKKKLSA